MLPVDSDQGETTGREPVGARPDGQPRDTENNQPAFAVHKNVHWRMALMV